MTRPFGQRIYAPVAAALLAAAIAGCAPEEYKPDYNPLIDDPEGNEPEVVDPPSRSEQYRPQIHFTPEKNWMNDPNGMVYADGVYHLFYQYNPRGNDWGNMSWGHATSTDLIRWTEQPVALTRDHLGAIFSGSCVIDRSNTAGFGANAMVALYTSAGDDGKQQQSLAYSTDDGKNFTRYAGNPVIHNDDDNLRDPKVFWHEASRKWVMSLAKGWKKGIAFYGSSDLKSWTPLSTFVTDLPGRPDLQWECPDLIELDYKGGKKWVLIVSVNPGGPVLGSGTMYFTGEFDGSVFTPDARNYPLWLDYGLDNYAGVTWSNTPGRSVMIGWMNNWSYAGQVPCNPWRSAMTLPRELKLVEYDGQPLLCSTVVKEIDTLAGGWTDAPGSWDDCKAYQLRLTLQLEGTTTVTLGNEKGEELVLEVYGNSRTLALRRNGRTGASAFNGSFSIPAVQGPLCMEGDVLTLDLFVDQSSVELFTLDGTLSMTNLVFPSAIYNRLRTSGPVQQVKLRKLSGIWK